MAFEHIAHHLSLRTAQVRLVLLALKQQIGDDVLDDYCHPCYFVLYRIPCHTGVAISSSTLALCVTLSMSFMTVCRYDLFIHTYIVLLTIPYAEKRKV